MRGRRRGRRRWSFSRSIRGREGRGEDWEWTSSFSLPFVLVFVFLSLALVALGSTAARPATSGRSGRQRESTRGARSRPDANTRNAQLPLAMPGGGSWQIRCTTVDLLAEWLERGTDLFREEFGLFPGGKVPALGELVVVDQFGIRPLRPAPRGWIEFVREDAHSHRDGDADAPDGEERCELVLPIETGAGKCRVRQPGDRDVVEDVVAREALGLSVKDA